MMHHIQPLFLGLIVGNRGGEELFYVGVAFFILFHHIIFDHF